MLGELIIMFVLAARVISGVLVFRLTEPPMPLWKVTVWAEKVRELDAAKPSAPLPEARTIEPVVALIAPVPEMVKAPGL